MPPEHPGAIKHVVVLMLENRSFDHMLGTVPGVEGVLDAKGELRDDLVNYAVPTDASSTAYRPKLGSVFFTPTNQEVHSGEYGGPSHSFTAASEQRFGASTDVSGETSPYYGAVVQTMPEGQPVGFVSSLRRALETDFGRHGTTLAAQQASLARDPVEEVMEVFTADQLPAIHALAREFCVCDHWFSEVPGPTEPNRLFTHTATSSGLTYNPWSYDPLDAPTIYERIDAAAPAQTWAMYGFDLLDSSNFSRLRDKPQAKRTFVEFRSDAEAGELPFYSFLCPRYVDAPEGLANSQHPPQDVRYGDALIAEVYKLLRNGPGWNQTLLILTYDEHGGYYDHVLPPPVEPPDASVSPNAFMQTQASKYHDSYLTQPDYTFRFDRLGFRVPTVLVSPLIPRGTVAKTPYRHTSILRFIADLLGTEPLTHRDANATSFAPLLSLDSPRVDCPSSVPSAALPKIDLRRTRPSRRAPNRTS